MQTTLYSESPLFVITDNAKSQLSVWNNTGGFCRIPVWFWSRNWAIQNVEACLGCYMYFIQQCFICPPLGYQCTANEGLLRIQYKCLVPIYVFQEMKLLFPKQNFNLLSPSSYTHISVRDLYTYFQDQSAYSAAWKYVDRSWEYINRSQTHEFGNWIWGRAIPTKWIHKWDFPCSVCQRMLGSNPWLFRVNSQCSETLPAMYNDRESIL